MAVASHRKTVTHEAEEFRQLKFGRPALIITDRQTDIKAEETRRGVQGGVHAEQSVGSYDAILLTHLEALPAGGTDLAARSAGTAARPAARGCPWVLDLDTDIIHTCMYTYQDTTSRHTQSATRATFVSLPPCLVYLGFAEDDVGAGGGRLEHIRRGEDDQCTAASALLHHYAVDARHRH